MIRRKKRTKKEEAPVEEVAVEEETETTEEEEVAEDDEEEEEEEAPTPAPKKKRSVSRKKAAPVEEVAEDDEEEEEEEEEAPTPAPKKKRSVSRKKKAAPAKKKVVEDEAEDDEEEEEKALAPKKKRSVSRKKKAAPVEEDDDDEDGKGKSHFGFISKRKTSAKKAIKLGEQMTRDAFISRLHASLSEELPEFEVTSKAQVNSLFRVFEEEVKRTISKHPFIFMGTKFKHSTNVARLTCVPSDPNGLRHTLSPEHIAVKMASFRVNNIDNNIDVIVEEDNEGDEIYTAGTWIPPKKNKSGDKILEEGYLEEDDTKQEELDAYLDARE